MDEKELDELMQMSLEERWQELLNDADEAIHHEEDRISKDMTLKKKDEKKDDKDRAEEK